MLLRLWMAVLLTAGFAVAAPPSENALILKVGPIDKPALRAGDSVSVTIPLSIARGYHVNANPAASEDYIPLEIVLRDSLGLRVGTVRYPAAKTWRLDGSTEDLKVYDGKFDVRVPLIAESGIPAGDHLLLGSVEFQACNSQVCLMPDSRAIKLTVRVLAAE